MKYYPVFLDVAGKPCLVVGAGHVGYRKAAMLAGCNARVTVVSPDFGEVWRTEPTPAVFLNRKAYDKKDLEGMFLVLAATDNADLNRQIKQDAAALNILANVADKEEISDFILPAVVTQGDLSIAVSTGGASPALAKRICRELGDHFGPEYAQLLTLMRAVRIKLLSQGHDPQSHKKIFHGLLENGILKQIKIGDINAVNQILEDVLGQGFEFEHLVSKGSSE
jgi:precorrin-2 dehydrogenase/sirohydrochlorin ferrochelatase